MAKVSGPLMSMEASGKFGGSLVFGSWKGRSVVRQLVTPSNPRLAGQTLARNHMRVTGELQKFANHQTKTRTYAGGTQQTPKEFWRSVAPAGQAWNGYMVKSCIGVGGANIVAALAAFALLSDGGDAYEAAAIVLAAPISAVAQKIAVTNATATAITAGQAYYVYEYGFAKAAGLPVPNDVPPVYTV